MVANDIDGADEANARALALAGRLCDRWAWMSAMTLHAIHLDLVVDDEEDERIVQGVL
jgi:hypothetical protein